MLWRVRIPGQPGVRDHIIASGVERLDVYPDDLPWSPRPYRAELEIAVGQGTTNRSSRWQLIVTSHSDDLARIEEEP